MEQAEPIQTNALEYNLMSSYTSGNKKCKTHLQKSELNLGKW